jgi:hypothetical protein
MDNKEMTELEKMAQAVKRINALVKTLDSTNPERDMQLKNKATLMQLCFKQYTVTEMMQAGIFEDYETEGSL